MNKEMRETLDKVAMYEEWTKRKALQAGNLAFASMFVIGVMAIIIQMLLTINIRFILGETVSVLAGGILYATIMIYNGIWDKCCLLYTSCRMKGMLRAGMMKRLENRSVFFFTNKKKRSGECFF